MQTLFQDRNSKEEIEFDGSIFRKEKINWKDSFLKEIKTEWKIAVWQSVWKEELIYIYKDWEILDDSWKLIEFSDFEEFMHFIYSEEQEILVEGYEVWDLHPRMLHTWKYETVQTHKVLDFKSWNIFNFNEWKISMIESCHNFRWVLLSEDEKVIFIKDDEKFTKTSVCSYYEIRMNMRYDRSERRKTWTTFISHITYDEAEHQIVFWYTYPKLFQKKDLKDPKQKELFRKIRWRMTEEAEGITYELYKWKTETVKLNSPDIK